jgi:SAM-dependent methyltransferase
VTALLYTADRTALGPALGERFVELTRDAATEAWLADVGARPHGFVTGALVSVLARFESIYEVHGRLGAYAMRLLSAEQLALLIGPGPHGRWLDVGAGAGFVTAELAPAFSEVHCTETAAQLRRRLSARGFHVHDIDLSTAALDQRFDVVSCFNVLDRTARPLALLRGLARQLAPGGRLLLSMPLPPSPHVHVAGGTVAPAERLPATPRSFEGAARLLTEALLLPAGFEVERFTRVPYLSRGDAGAPYYALDAALWVLRGP